MEDLGGQLPDEVNVVADEDKRPLVGAERHDERLDGVDVEMGRWLVHEQKIRGIYQEFDQIQTGLLSAAQDGGLLEDVILSEKEGAEDASGVIL